MFVINLKQKKLKLKKLTIIFFIITCFIAAIILISLYVSQENFRKWIDINILKKDITESESTIFSLDSGKNNQIYAYENYIALLNDKKVTLYNNFAEEQGTIDVNINSAIFASSEKYLAIAEKNGNDLYLVYDKTYLWNTKIDGNILNITVNQAGYVTVISTDATSKSILYVYNSSGESLLKSFFFSTRIIDISMSSNNKYIAIGELDTSGAIIQSNIKVLSIENSQNDAQNAIIYTYNAPKGSLIVDVEYNDKNTITCMYDSHIDILSSNFDGNDNINTILDTKNNNMNFCSIKFNNNIIYTNEEGNGIFDTNSNIHICNIFNQQTNLYSIEDVIKDLYTSENIIVVNTGTELYFLNASGWLIKKYSSSQEITNVIFSDKIAAIVYKDKISIIDL